MRSMATSRRSGARCTRWNGAIVDVTQPNNPNFDLWYPAHVPRNFPKIAESTTGAGGRRGKRTAVCPSEDDRGQRQMRAEPASAIRDLADNDFRSDPTDYVLRRRAPKRTFRLVRPSALPIDQRQHWREYCCRASPQMRSTTTRHGGRISVRRQARQHGCAPRPARGCATDKLVGNINLYKATTVRDPRLRQSLRLPCTATDLRGTRDTDPKHQICGRSRAQGLRVDVVVVAAVYERLRPRCGARIFLLLPRYW